MNLHVVCLHRVFWSLYLKGLCVQIHVSLLLLQTELWILIMRKMMDIIKGQLVKGQFYQSPILPLLHMSRPASRDQNVGAFVPEGVCSWDFCVCQKCSRHRLSPEGKHDWQTDSSTGSSLWVSSAGFQIKGDYLENLVLTSSRTLACCWRPHFIPHPVWLNLWR